MPFFTIHNSYCSIPYWRQATGVRNTSYTPVPGTGTMLLYSVHINFNDRTILVSFFGR